MKKFLPIVAFISLCVASLVYLLPSFHVNIKGKTYVFTNLPSLADNTISGLKVEVPRLSPTYSYTIESASQVSNKDWNLIATKDLRTLEERVESFIGKTYEVRLDNKDGKAVFTVFTQNPLGSSASVLTTNNADFTVSAQAPSISSEDVATDTEQQANLQKLNLSRSDFGDATVSASQQQQGVKYEIKLPISTLSPEKINLIKTNSGSPINVFIGGKDFTGSFVSNINAIPTDLVITSAASVEEAAMLRTFLNTGSYYMGYKQISSQVYAAKYPWAKMAALSILFVAFAIGLSIITKKNLSVRRVLLIAGYTVMGLAALKLFGMTVTTGVILILAAVLLMSLLQVREYYLIGFGAAVLLIQLFGYLYFVQLNWTQIIILLITSALIWSTNYYGFNIKK